MIFFFSRDRFYVPDWRPAPERPGAYRSVSAAQGQGQQLRCSIITVALLKDKDNNSTNQGQENSSAPKEQKQQ